MNVLPFSDIKATYEELQVEFDLAYKRVMNSGWYLLGSELEAFEIEFAAYCNVKHCIGVGNGLEALHLVLRSWGIGYGDEVIVPSNTYIATWLAVSHTGATPIPVEPCLLSYNLNPEKIEAAITEKTKAIIPVHLYGLPADMNKILAIAQKYQLKVLEDGAQAHGAKYCGQKIGGLADAAGISMYPGKNLGAFGDAGVITTNDDETAKQVRILRNYGSQIKYQHEVIGFNSRMDELQAAFLRVKLKRLDEWNMRRQKCAQMYLDGFQTNKEIMCPQVPALANPVWHLFVVRTQNRDFLQEKLVRKGVSSLIHYPIPPHLSAAYANYGWNKGEFPIAEKIANEVLSLPIGPHMTEEQIQYIIESVLE